MKGRRMLLLLIAAGCGGRHPTEDALVAPGVFGASVTNDQAYLAGYANVTLATSTTPTQGSLEVRALPSGTAVIPVSPDGYGAGFGRNSSTLLFRRAPSAATDGLSTYYGTLWAWTPGWSAPAPLTTGYDTLLATAPDFSVGLVFDVMAPSQLAAGTVRLWRVIDCSAASCPTVALASNVQVNRLSVSADGRYASYGVTHTSGGSSTEDVWLVSIADGQTTQVASTVVPSQVDFTGSFFDFSPDGSMLATTSMVQGNPMQLQVISTATAAPVDWAPQPAGTLCTDVTFGDDATLYTEAFDTAGVRSVLRTTAQTASHFVDGTYFVLTHAFPGTERYMYFTTMPVANVEENLPRDLWLVDLTDATPAPVRIASASNGALRFSSDVTAAFAFDDYDTTSGYGSLIHVSLPDETIAEVDPLVYSGGAAFPLGSTKLLYFQTPTSPPLAGTTGGRIVEWIDGTATPLEGDAHNYLTVQNPTTMYVTRADPTAVYRRSLQ